MEEAIRKEKQTIIAPGRTLSLLCPELQRNLVPHREASDVTIDLSGVQMIDSIGLRC
jgi:anti-anti-sigma regulatory factor